MEDFATGHSAAGDDKRRQPAQEWRLNAQGKRRRGTMICQLCGRPLGVKTEAHHLTPKSLGGRETIPLHPICHRKIHTTLTEQELRRAFHTIEALRAHDEIGCFIAWIANKHPDFYVATHDARARGGKRHRP